MYTMTLILPTVEVHAHVISQNHFRYCQLLQENSIEDPNLFTVIGDFLMGVLWITSMGSLTSGMANISLAIRSAQQLGLDIGAFKTWIAPSGQAYESRDPNIQIISMICWCILYEHDFTFAHARKLPFLISTENPRSFEHVESTIKDHQPFSNSAIWISLFRLLQICKKVTIFTRYVPSDIDEPSWLKSLEELKAGLLSWRDKLPPSLRASVLITSAVELLLDIQTPSRPRYTKLDQVMLIYSHSLYHCMNILLNKTSFLYLLDTDQYSQSKEQVVLCVDSAREITKLLYIFNDLKTEYENIPPFFYYCVFTGGAIHSLSTRFFGRTEEIMNTVHYHISLLKRCKYSPSARAKYLADWLDDPFNGTVEFASVL